MKVVRPFLFLGLLVVAVFLMGQTCNGTASPPPATPTVTDIGEAGELQTDARVRREQAVVWAGPGSSSVLPRLDHSRWVDLPAGSLITTDENGEGWVDIQECMLIYIFQESGLTRAACPKSSYTGGNVTCALEGTSVYNNQCAGQVIIQTLSAEIALAGTWVSVTYLADRLATVVMVFDDDPGRESRVTVRPVLDFEQRTLGPPVVVTEEHFWFTTPGDEAVAIADLEARIPHPFEDLERLADELDLWPWLERVQERAAADNVPFPEFVEESESVVLQGGGGALEDRRVQEALLRGVPWESLLEEVFAGQEVSLIVVLPDFEEDARAFEYAPPVARRLLAEADFSSATPLVLLFPPEEEHLAFFAEMMAESLSSMGVELALEGISTADAAEVAHKLILEGVGVLWLGNDFLDVDLVPPPDETPPTLTRLDVSPAEPKAGQRVTLTVQATDEESGLDRVEMYVERRLVQRCSGSRCSVVVGPLSAGVVQFQVRLVDRAGNELIDQGAFSVAVGKPDLVVPVLKITGPAKAIDDETTELPIQVTVRNQGDAPADTFKIAVEYTGARGSFVVPFTVEGQQSIWYPQTRSAMKPGEERNFAGHVRLRSELLDPSSSRLTITLQAIADSCSGEEFVEPYCRVDESNEDNNASKPVPVSGRNVFLPPERLVPVAPELAPPALEGFDREPEPDVLLWGGGGALKDPPVQSAVLAAVPWEEILADLANYKIQRIQVSFPEQETIIKESLFDPDRAREWLAEAGYPEGIQLVLLYPQGDEPLAILAKWMMEGLNNVGFRVEPVGLEPREAGAEFRELIAAGEPAVWVSRP